MDWISQCIDKIIQSQIWRFISTHFYWVDWLTLFFVIWGIIYGLRRGFLRMLVQTLELFLIAYITFLYHEKAALQLQTYLPFISSKLRPAAGFLVIGVPVTLVIAFLDQQLARLFQANVVAPLRVVGGLALGVFYGLFLWSFLSQPFVETPVHSIQKGYEKGVSISGPLIKKLAPSLYQKVTP